MEHLVLLENISKHFCADLNANGLFWLDHFLFGSKQGISWWHMGVFPMCLDSGIHVGDNSVEVVVSLPPFREPGKLRPITLGKAGTKLVALVLPLANV